jgi:hypothetical protein
MTVIGIIYLVLGYWAAGIVMSKMGIVYIGELGKYFVSRVFWSILLGWLIIPAAIIIKLVEK